MESREYYSREDVQRALLEQARDREVQVCFGAGVMGPRPEIVSSLGDIKDLVRQGMTSFHISVERWKDPLRLKSGMSKRELDELRIGWDLLIDLDSKCLEFSVYACQLVVELLKFYEVKDFSVKFSGNHGFHIGVCYEAFPSELFGRGLKNYFPDGIREIAEHIRSKIREHLAVKILGNYSVEDALFMAGKKKEDVSKEFDPFSVVDIDSVLISLRHMFRSAYSINEKSGLVSAPVSVDELMNFDWKNLERFRPENARVELGFLDRNAETRGAFHLFDVLGKDRKVTGMQDDIKERAGWAESADVLVKDEFFPPCVKSLMKGVSEDGRKRAVFLMINFFRNMGWDFEKIEKFLLEWNSLNYEKLRDGYISSQVSWIRRNPNKMLPPNCSNNAYYKTMGVCCPDELCKLVKNPVNYSLRRLRLSDGRNKGGKGTRGRRES